MYTYEMYTYGDFFVLVGYFTTRNWLSQLQRPRSPGPVMGKLETEDESEGLRTGRGRGVSSRAVWGQGAGDQCPSSKAGRYRENYFLQAFNSVQAFRD